MKSTKDVVRKLKSAALVIATIVQSREGGSKSDRNDTIETY